MGYKWCFVPMCKSTSVSTPKKLFLVVPTDRKRRIKWYKAAKRCERTSYSKWELYCCEDHFELSADQQNWMQFNLMKGTGYSPCRIILKKNVIPHIFRCQLQGYSKERKCRKEVDGTIKNAKCFRKRRKEVDSTIKTFKKVKTETYEEVTFSGENLADHISALTPITDAYIKKENTFSPLSDSKMVSNQDNSSSNEVFPALPEKIVLICENKSEFYEFDSYFKYQDDDSIEGGNLNLEPEVVIRTEEDLPCNDIVTEMEFEDCNEGDNPCTSEADNLQKINELLVYSLKNYSFDDVNREVFSCRLCSFKTLYMKKLNKHYTIHKGEKPYACHLCSYQADQKAVYNKHLLTHAMVKSYNCDSCSYKTNMKSNLEIHVSNNCKALSCSVCPFESYDNMSLRYHILTHTKKLTCKLCPFETSGGKADLKRHTNFTHSGRMLYSCKVCPYKTVLELSIKKHMTYAGSDLCLRQTSFNVDAGEYDGTHGKKLPLTCSFCSFSALTKVKLEKHIETHAVIKNQLSCDVCCYSAVSSSSLKIHELTHRVFSCKMCSFQINTKEELTHHYLLHDIFACENCDFITNEKHTLENHAKKHDKQLSCEWCSYQTIYMLHLKEHLRSHTEVKT